MENISQQTKLKRVAQREYSSFLSMTIIRMYTSNIPENILQLLIDSAKLFLTLKQICADYSEC